MVSAALTKASDSNSASLIRWAGMSAPDDFKHMFGAMWNHDSNTPGAAVERMVCDQEDFAPARNTPNTTAYTVPGTGRFYVTQYGQDRRLNSDIQEGDLDNFAFANMRSLPMTFVHKMTHFDGINTAIIMRTVDPANGAYNCFMLDNDEKTTIAQKSAWFAGEAYWSRQFDMQFSDPTPGNVVDREAPQTVKCRTPTRRLRVSSFFLRAFLLLSSFFSIDLVPKVSDAIVAYRNRKYSSIRATARAFSLSDRTLRRYLDGGVSRAISYEYEQYLSPAEEKILIKYILRLDSLGNSISPAFTRNLTYEIRLSTDAFLDSSDYSLPRYVLRRQATPPTPYNKRRVYEITRSRTSSRD